MSTVRPLRALPKTDLHVHLEGSIRPASLVELAAENGVPMPRCVRGGRFHFKGFEDFIAQYETLEPCLANPADCRRIAYEFCADEAAEGVRYAEVTFSIPGPGERLGDWDAPVVAVLEGLRAGEADFGVRAGLVLDVIRGFDLEVAERTLAVALRHQDAGVIGLGLAGREAGNPPERFAEVFTQARRAGLASLPHAGEAAGPESVWGALAALGADRIGHGIRALGDPVLVAELRERAVPLEVCLTSNVCTAVVASLETHPLPQLLEAGLVVTLNSDDPSMFASPLAGEYELARTVFGLSDDELAGIACNGVVASFANDATKRSLLGAIETWVGAESADATARSEVRNEHTDAATCPAPEPRQRA